MVAALNVYRIGTDKQFTAAEVAQVERFATMAALAFDSARQRDTLREQARTDGLTGLLNHRACHERLSEEIARAAARGPAAQRGRPRPRPLQDGQRRLRARRGRQGAGRRGRQAALRRARGRRRRAARRRGVRADPARRRRRPRRRGGRARPRGDRRGRRSAAGRSRAPPASPRSPTTRATPARLLELADGALYWAKRSGRDQSRRYDRRLAGQLSGDGQRAEVEALLAREGSIVPVFQPVLELATGRVAGYEALARMPDGPFRPPDQWFNQAHRAGLGPALEAAALRAALRAGGRPERTFLALNVSPGALLVPRSARRCPRTSTGIVIELTEHELFSTDPALDRELERLRARGARIALDDAGNGYAGLQQIIRIAPDILKLDRSLVDGVHDDPHRFALLEALISFASTTRAAVCAEGVETLEDLAVLAGDGRHLRAGLGARAPGRAVGGARAAGRGRRDGGGADRHARRARAARRHGARRSAT